MRQAVVGVGAVLALGLAGAAGFLAAGELGATDDDGRREVVDQPDSVDPYGGSMASRAEPLYEPSVDDSYDDYDSYDEPGSYPEWEGFDLDCADVDGPIYVDDEDPHGLDGDGDGVACEWG